MAEIDFTITAEAERRERVMNETDKINLSATFEPMTTYRSGSTGLPCITIAGISAFFYLHDDGAMRVSLHFDGVDPDVTPEWSEHVPVKVDVGGVIVYEIDDKGQEVVHLDPSNIKWRNG